MSSHSLPLASDIYFLAEDGESIPKGLVNIQDDRGDTPLHLAAYFTNDDAVQRLLDVGAASNTQNHHGMTALHLAAAAAAKESILTTGSLLAAKADPNIKNNDGDTALHLAAREGNTSVVQLLLTEGANRHEKNNNGYTPFHCATHMKHVKTLLLLMSTPATKTPKPETETETERSYTTKEIYDLAIAGKEIPKKFVNIQNKYGQTALHETAGNGHVAAIGALLVAGADVHAKDKDGEIALHLAAGNGDVAAIGALLAAGANVHAKDNDGLTALHIAAWNGHVDAIGALLVAGADVHAKEKCGVTALRDAVWNGHVAAIGALLEAGADVHAKDKGGETALHEAARNGHVAAIGVLLVAGADVYAKDKGGETALHKAARNGKAAAIEALKTHEKSMLNEPFNHIHLNFNGFPQERIEEFENCLVKLAKYYQEHPKNGPAEKRILQSLSLIGLHLTERGQAALDIIVANDVKVHQNVPALKNIIKHYLALTVLAPPKTPPKTASADLSKPTSSSGVAALSESLTAPIARLTP